VNILRPEKKLAVISAFTEGCSIRSIVRMTGVHKKTVMKLLVEIGTKCEQMIKATMYGIRCEAVECDEIWTFVGKKDGMVNADERKAHPELGDQYTYIALDPISKLIPAFHIGKRDSVNTHRFIEDLSHRIDGSTQVSTDAWGPYSPAISRYFGNRATYAQITTFYASQNPGPGRYAPPRVSERRSRKSLAFPLRQGLYVLCRAEEFDAENEDCPISSADIGLLPQAGQSQSCCGAVLLDVQFLSDSSVPSRDASYGCWRHK
jgi:IS1 family transposase